MVDDHGDEDRDDLDVINLRLPADGRYSRVARVAASAVAIRLGFESDAIEDLRIAVDEALILLLRRTHAPAWADHQALDPSSLDLVFEARPASLQVSLALDPAPVPTDPHRDDLDALHRFGELLPARIEALRVAPAEGVVSLALR